MLKKQLQAVEAFARVYEPDPVHSGQVVRISLALFDALRDMHGLDERARVLLHVAALLHDVGYAKGAGGHHKRSRDLIVASDLPGFSETDLAIIACIARYHRKALPRARHKVYRTLDRAQRDLVCKLASLLRVADGLDRSHISSVQSVHIELEGDVVRVLVDQSPPEPADLEAALKKSDLFEKTFRRTLTLQ